MIFPFPIAAFNSGTCITRICRVALKCFQVEI
jgi:hypothetical protein